MAQAKVTDVIVKTDVGRTVTIEGSMDGFAAALRKPANKFDEVMARESDINKRFAAEIDANRATRETAEKAAAAKESAATPAAPRTVETATEGSK